MPAYTVAVRLGGLRPGIADELAESLEGRPLVRGVSVHTGPEGWQVELRAVVQHDDLQGAIVYAGLTVRRALAEVKTPLDRMAVSGARR